MTSGDAPVVVQVVAFYPPHLGGVERVVAELSQSIAARGRRVMVLTSGQGAGSAPRTYYEGPVLVRRHRSWLLAHTAVMPGLLWSLLRLPRDAVVHVHVAHAFVGEVVRLASLLRRTPYIVHFHLDIDPSGPAGRLLPAYKRLLMRGTLRRARGVVALTSEMAADLVRDYQVDPGRVHVIGNGVSSEFHSAGAARTVPPADRPLRILFAGRLAAQKNVPRLLRALALVSSQVDVVIAGDGEDRDALAEQAHELGLEFVTFAGHCGSERLRELMTWADLLVMTSHKEGMPLVLIEAMAMGLPILATDVPGCRGLLNGIGVLVPADDAEVAHGIDALARDRALLAQMSAAGRRAALRLRWPDIAGEVLALYAKLGQAGARTSDVAA